MTPLIATDLVSFQGIECLHEIVGADRHMLVEDILREMVNIESGVRVRFPGPSPVSIERADFPALATVPYLVCEKTDGWRALLVLCSFKGQNVVCVFDRKLTPYLIYLQEVPVALWQGSVFDGEVVWNKRTQRWTFLVFDALRVSGIPIYLRTFRERMEIARAAWGPYVPTEYDTMWVCIKQFIPCEDIQALGGHLAKVQHEFETDGIILTPDVGDVVFGRHRGMFKLKTAGKHSVDFWVDRSGRGLCVWDPTARMHIKVGTISGPPSVGCTIVECVHDGESEWKVVQCRDDKDHANDMLTYKKTMLNMEEKITLNEIVRLF